MKLSITLRPRGRQETNLLFRPIHVYEHEQSFGGLVVSTLYPELKAVFSRPSLYCSVIEEDFGKRNIYNRPI